MSKKSLIFAFSLLLLALALTAAVSTTAANPATQSIPLQEMWLAGEDFAAGRGQNSRVDARGITLAPGAVQAVYVSLPLTASIPFNGLIPQWTGVTLADAANFRLYVRSGEPLAEAEWVELPADMDLTLPEDEAITGGLYMIPDAADTHRLLQIRVELQHTRGSTVPRLERLRLTLIDSSAAPTVAEAIASQRTLSSTAAESASDASESYPKPFIVSREVWCTDPACDYSEGLSYHPVSHLILHHTVTSVTTNPIATLQAIWKYHAVTRGWGDIGYNYLVDPQGVLYEGHLGGDNVVGTHAGDANTGSMALSMMGDFTNLVPPAAMQEAAVELFAWKADQMDIDVYDSSYMPDADLWWGLPHLMGHRDVYGTTACPGESAHPLIPAIRDEVARRIGFSPVHLYYDELSSQTNFVKSSGDGEDYWMDGPRGCGFNTHAYYTWSVDDPLQSSNWAEWRPAVPASGQYELSAYAPYCYTRRADTAGAVYDITHAHGTSTVTVDQSDNLGIWVPLGVYEFAAGTTGKVRLTDLTSTDSGLGVWFDAIRLRSLDNVVPQVIALAPLEGTWLESGNVEFRWALNDESPVTAQSLQVATDPDFNDLLDVPLATSTRSSSHSLDDGVHFWRIKLSTSRGETMFSPGIRFGIDTTPPTSSVTTLLEHEDGSFYVIWKGEDAGSGVVGYNVEYRAEGTDQWESWQLDTPRTAARFVPPRPDLTYWFRSQARDALDRLEPFPVGTGDASTAESVLITSQFMLPFTAKE